MKTPNIYSDIEENGYVVFSIKKSTLPNYYPGTSNDFPGIPLKEPKVYDLITIKVFISDGTGDLPRTVDDFIDLTIKSIVDGKVTAEVLTVLPEDFYFKTGSSMEILEEEILYHIPVGSSLKDRVLN